MNVIEELTEDRVDRAYVERRVEDWERRLLALYADISKWLPAGWSAVESGGVPMHEELMRRFGMPARQLPILLLERDHTMQAILKPRGLWIVGANGRVDFINSDKHYLIIDHAETFSEPDWRISELRDRMNEECLSGDSLRKRLS